MNTEDETKDIKHIKNEIEFYKNANNCLRRILLSKDKNMKELSTRILETHQDTIEQIKMLSLQLQVSISDLEESPNDLMTHFTNRNDSIMTYPEYKNFFNIERELESFSTNITTLHGFIEDINLNRIIKTDIPKYTHSIRALKYEMREHLNSYSVNYKKIQMLEEYLSILYEEESQKKKSIEKPEVDTNQSSTSIDLVRMTEKLPTEIIQNIQSYWMNAYNRVNYLLCDYRYMQIISNLNSKILKEYLYSLTNVRMPTKLKNVNLLYNTKILMSKYIYVLMMKNKKIDPDISINIMRDMVLKFGNRKKMRFSYRS